MADEKARPPGLERRGRKAQRNPSYREKAPRRSSRGGRFWRNKWFWRAAAVLGLVVLVGVPVVAELTQSRQLSQLEEWDSIVQRLNRNPDDTGALQDLGGFYQRQAQLLRTQGDHDNSVNMLAYAAESYARVLELEPGNGAAVAGVRLALRDLGAGLLLRAGVPVNDPGDPGEAARTFEEAANFYRDALAQEPSNAGLARMLTAALYYQGLAYQELGQQSLALESWQTAAGLAAPDWYYVQQALQMVQHYKGP